MDKEVPTLLTLEKTCRTCLNNSEEMSMLSEYITNKTNITLKEVLVNSGIMKVSPKDELPEQICLPCVKYTKNFYYFQKQCEKAELTLREYFNCPIQQTMLDVKPDLDSLNDVHNFDPEDELPIGVNFLIDECDVHCCELCDTKCESEAELKTHLKCHVQPENNIQPSGHPKHGRIPKKDKKCPECSECYSNKADLKLHLLSKHIKTKHRHTCKICEKDYIKKKFLDLHNILYHKKQVERVKTVKSSPIRHNHTCDKCGKKYKLLSSLQIHEKMCKPGAISLECPHCDMCFNIYSELTSHIRQTHADMKPFVCYVCKKGFVSNESLRVHLRIHERVEGKILNCPSCTRVFSDERNLNKHVKKNHTGESHTCQLCAKSFTHDSKLKLHMTLHTSYNEMKFCCKFCPKRFNRSHHLNNHERIHNGQKPYLCTVCGKGFRQSYGLTLHMRAHTGVRVHFCKECGKSFAQAQTLANHMFTHTGVKPCMCSSCGKRFSSISSLRMHMTNIHDSELPPKRSASQKARPIKGTKSNDKPQIHKIASFRSCTVCDMSFPTRSSLQMHMRKHMYQFFCGTCNKGFTLATALDAHSNKPCEKSTKYTCSEPGCSSSYNRPEHLKIHFRRAHTKERPFICNECGKGFCESSDLKVHVRRHTGEKPYVCCYCQKGYAASNDLNIHKRKHTGEKPYMCSICSKRFVTSSSLTSHMRWSHTSKEAINSKSETLTTASEIATETL